ncbi:MAG: MotA/TolQ/ExbB proton channel family protein [Lautropia sp.]
MPDSDSRLSAPPTGHAPGQDLPTPVAPIPDGSAAPAVSLSPVPDPQAIPTPATPLPGPDALGFEHFLAATDTVARVVLTILLLMSLVTWTVILVRAFAAPAQQRRRKRFLARFWAAGSIDEIETAVREHGDGDPFANVARHGLTALAQVPRLPAAGSGSLDTPAALLTRMLRRGIDQGRRAAGFGLGALASIASAAPFVGLFGTVWGVYQALVAIGRSGQGTLDKVAGPIGEALIMTGLGLAVAIPAVLAYNFFSKRVRDHGADLDSFAHDVFTLFGSGMRTPQRMAAASREDADEDDFAALPARHAHGTAAAASASAAARSR